MMVIFFLTLLVVVIPALHVINERSVQRIALFIGATQLALLAFSGKIDDSLSDFMVSGANQILSHTFTVVINKIVCLLNMFIV